MDNFNVSGFLLLGFSAKPEQELFYASLFLVLYVLALTGNMLIITTTSLDDSLQSPMYFFLKHLSLLDLCYISVTVPKFIYNAFKQSGTISLWECIVQCFTLITCSSAEMAMLTLMSYDRYVAICLPLHYDVIMNVRTCLHGIAGVWISGTLSGVMHTAATFSIQFCGPRIIHQFFCDIPQILKLSCSNDYIREVGVSVFFILLSFGCIIFIGCSYVQIFSSVLRIPSAEGRTKAFSTCIPHLAVVILFASTGFFEFLKPHSENPSALDIVLTIFYSIVPPTLNPLIYSLRNKAMKAALRMVFKRNSILLKGTESQVWELSSRVKCRYWQLTHMLKEEVPERVLVISLGSRKILSCLGVTHSKKSRTMDNFTTSGFLLRGFSSKPEQEITYASLLLVLYLLVLAGNMLIIITTSLDDSLQSPM
ncbi:olfactory receptor 14J1-like [Sorex fumeus]|uniref:olfactory receptor 14J1-like n=1 Tax=Sorex fumeus TaxID=62283 RepID=UPI0024ACB9B5|nr:olfactory receptor 14J1-like [Sorex fumeus]